jgi:hemerythrin-like domain-containing protein
MDKSGLKSPWKASATAILSAESLEQTNMLNTIKSTAPKQNEVSEDAVSMLLGCHERIRHFAGTAVRLASGNDLPNEEVASAAEKLHRYFTVALPLHEADENESLHPRLRAAAPEGELAGLAADAMVEEHRSIDEIVERLVPLCELLKRNPAIHGELALQLRQLSTALQQMFDSHLKLEEETIFPAMRKYLTEGQLAEILQEMRARRNTPKSAV